MGDLARDTCGVSPAIGLIRASHFQPTVAVTAFTTALAVSSGRGAGSIAVGAAALSGQLAVGWSNDYIDRNRDRAAGRWDKPIPGSQISAEVVRRCAILAVVICVPLSLLSGWRAASVHLAAVSVALIYNWRLKNTVFSVVPYAAAFGALPAFVSLGGGAHRAPPLWAMVAAGLLGAGAHFVNTLPDIELDTRTGVHGLPHRIGATASLIVGAGLLAGSTAVIVVAPGSGLGFLGACLAALSGVAVVGVVLATLLGRAREAWPLCLMTAAATVALYIARR